MRRSISSILGRNNPENKITWADTQTAQAHGITSRRGMRKNLGDIRQAQSDARARDFLLNHGPFGASAPDTGAGSRLAEAGYKDQNSISSKAKKMVDIKPDDWSAANEALKVFPRKSS
jgi:hypothetical protein